MQDQFKQFHDEIQKEFHGNQSKLTIYPDGGILLDVKIGDEDYVMAYFQAVGVGIGKLSTATFGWEGYDFPFDTFEEAKNYLISLLKKQ